MHHPALQSDFQPPYFPPPFHHTTQSPPQQQNHGSHGIEYLGAADPYGHVVSVSSHIFSQLKTIPLSSTKIHVFSLLFFVSENQKYQHYNQLTGLRPTQEQLGIHRTHREAELQGHVVSRKVKLDSRFLFKMNL